MFEERDDIRQRIGDQMDERNSLRQVFREATNKWYDYQRAIRAQKQMKWEEEKKKQEEERLAYQKKLEEEEAKKIPYEEEQALCDYLADYLVRTYLSDSKKDEDKNAKSEFVKVDDDPFAGMKPMNKKTDDIFLQMKGKKKPRKRESKKKPAGNFTLNVDSFEQFGLLNLTPPTSIDMVEASVAELRAKKEWYSKQPRGSVPTAQQIRQSNEKAVAKLRQGNSTQTVPKESNGKKGGEFALSNDDFAPLGGGSSSTSAMNSTWGQKTVEEPASEEQETEEPDATETEE